MKSLVTTRGLRRGVLVVAASCLSLVAQALDLNPVADAYVRSGPTYQNTPFGSATTLELKKSASATDDFNREIYLRFDLSTLTSVRLAKLRLYGNETAPEVVNAQVYAASNTSWSETGITWANKPATGPMVFESVTVQGSAQYHEWDVTPYLAAERLAGRTLVTLVIKSAATSTTGNIVFNSRQNGSNKPILVVEEAHPWTYYEAEAGTVTGGFINTGTTWGQVPFEARGKKTVTLDAQGDNIRWSNVKSASHATLRYSIGDGKTGVVKIYTATNSNGPWTERGTFNLTSAGLRELRTGGDRPTDGIVRYFDEAMTPAAIPNNVFVKVQKETNDTEAYQIDFLDLETAPVDPLPIPSGYLAVVKNTGNDRQAIMDAITNSAGTGKKVWIPAGTYTINTAGGPANGGIVVPAGYTIKGAGIWHTKLIMNFGFDQSRLFSMPGPSTFSDFKVEAPTFNSLSGLTNSAAFRAGDGSSGHTIERVWVERITMFLGLRVNNCLISECRVRNTYKDSIHFAQSSSNNVIQKNCIRNSGDDNVALVSYSNDQMTNNTVQYNLGECGWWGRGFTNIGGDGNELYANVAVDCTKSGITNMVEDFGGNQTAESLNWVIEHNLVVRCGNQHNHPQAGALGIYVGSNMGAKPHSGRMEYNLVVEPLYTAAWLEGKIGDAAAGRTVYFRYNGLPNPTLGSTATNPYWTRKWVTLPGTGGSLVDTPNFDL